MPAASSLCHAPPAPWRHALAMALVQPVRRLTPWPVPALLCWAGCWAVFTLLRGTALPWAYLDVVAWSLGTMTGGALALLQSRPWRRLIVALGFPLSTALLGLHGAAAGWWLLPLALLAWLYPTQAWRDAPWFPTSAKALQGLADAVPLTPAARVLDAGCGLGHGLRALRQHYPQARLSGTEWSPALAWLTRLRCPWAAVQRGDMWADAWQDQDLVYLFQRPESMPRALAKAQAEMRPGSWLVSMAFEAPGLVPHQVLHVVAGRPVWIYRMGHQATDAPLKSHKPCADMQNMTSGRARSTRSRRKG